MWVGSGEIIFPNWQWPTMRTQGPWEGMLAMLAETLSPKWLMRVAEGFSSIASLRLDGDGGTSFQQRMTDEEKLVNCGLMPISCEKPGQSFVTSVDARYRPHVLPKSPQGYKTASEMLNGFFTCFTVFWKRVSSLYSQLIWPFFICIFPFPQNLSERVDGMEAQVSSFPDFVFIPMYLEEAFKLTIWKETRVGQFGVFLLPPRIPNQHLLCQILYITAASDL